MFDNFCTPADLLFSLADRNIRETSIVLANQIHRVPLKCDAEMRNSRQPISHDETSHADEMEVMERQRNRNIWHQLRRHQLVR